MASTSTATALLHVTTAAALQPLSDNMCALPQAEDGVAVKGSKLFDFETCVEIGLRYKKVFCMPCL